ncbi:uncharacterized protein [Heptranchias perlo]|uniref:uncharacterized protein n=1 Tax=Heptranchias perlo TaxID=212740 RepID=UPI00355A20AF
MGCGCTGTVIFLIFVPMWCSTTSETIYGFLHHSVSLTYTRPNDTVEILCKFGDNKVFEWEADSSTTYFGPFSGRTKLKQASVLIGELQMDDAGIYKLLFTNQNGDVTSQTILLEVLEPLSKPSINCTGNSSVVYFNCYLSNQSSSVSTEWKYQNAAVIPDANVVLSNEGKILTISKPEKFPGEYTCIVKQPNNSSQSNPILVQACFGKEGYSRTHFAILAFFVVAFGIVIIIIVWFYQKRNKANPKNENEVPKEPQNTEASQDESEKIRGDSEETDRPKDMEQGAPFIPVIEQDETSFSGGRSSL